MMKKLRVALIGQGRSGKNIHGKFLLSENNKNFEVAYVVDRDPKMRAMAKEAYAGCVTLAEYTELFGKKDVDFVVNASYSNEHYPITKDLLEHGFNVLTEKPFAKTYFECMTLEKTAKEHGVLLAVFQNTQKAPFYLDAIEKIKSGVLGDIKQISIRYNNLARRWDWQTLQKMVGGSAYNTGPHPIAMALGFLDFDENTKLVFSKLDTALTSGDAEDYVKLILTAPNKPVIDIEMNSTDAFSDYNLKIQGSRGTMKSTPASFKMKYYLDSENPARPVIEQSLRNEEGLPVYCSEKLVCHEEEGSYDGNAFNVGTASIYNDVYLALTEKKPLAVTCAQAAQVIRIIEQAHAENPLPVKWI